MGRRISPPHLIALMLAMLFLGGCSAWLPQPTPTAMPTPTPTTGQIRGILQFEDKSLLGAQVLVSFGTPPLSIEGELFSVTTKGVPPSDSGAFLLEGVPPGKYCLWIRYTGILSPSSSILRDEKGMPIVFEVQAGQVTDLKTIPVKEK